MQATCTARLSLMGGLTVQHCQRFERAQEQGDESKGSLGRLVFLPSSGTCVSEVRFVTPKVEVNLCDQAGNPGPEVPAVK